MPAARVSPADEPAAAWPAADRRGPAAAAHGLGGAPASPGDTTLPDPSGHRLASSNNAHRTSDTGNKAPCPVTPTKATTATPDWSPATTVTSLGLSPYQRLLEALTNDSRWQKDVDLGRRVGFYRFRGELGTGNFSQVKVAVHCLVKEKVAVKILDKSKMDAKTQRMLAREIASMESLHHPHVIRLYEVIETLSRVHLALEFAPGGELFQKITSDGRYPEDEARIVFAQVASAVNHMHELNIVHRDIKAENVFIAGHNLVKVGDFGFSTQLRSREEALSTFCGSPPYAAPELFRDESYAGPCVDVWALGVLLYFVVTACMPFRAQTVAALKKLILEGHYALPEYLSEHCKKLIASILQVCPQDRPTVADIGRSEWLRGQRLPEGYARYNMYPTLDPEATVSEEELETRAHLRELGIGEELMRDCADKGARSAVTGAYRIVLHKIQTATPTALDNVDSESAGTATGTPSPGTHKADRVSLGPDRLFSVKSRKSRACVVL
ncbi:serine/threonine-protein kinase NIM1-like [Dermacentor albipictus]|uniref:serine/threonine-protein kinase NIM1-like n=1 Tax=Dermacentor albipictus TaxID=60249 RepID=UPI0031FD8DA4